MGCRVPAGRILMRYTLVYVGIQVRDMERSVSFYRDVLGMQVVRRQHVPETGGEWAELRSIGSKQMLELNWYPDASKFLPDPIAPGSWTTSRSSARMSSGPTGSCWRRGPGPDTRPSPRGTAGSPTSKTRTEFGSS